MKIKIGFIGAGGIAQAHLRNLATMKDISLVAICDNFRDTAARMAKNFGTKAYTDYRVMIDQENLDAIFVCLPPFAHGKAEILAAQKGIHLFIEKPITISAEQGEQIGRAIENSGIICSIGYNCRYLDIVDRTISILKENTVGMVIGLNLTDFAWEKNWWRDKAKSGGQIVEQTTHIIDLARYLLGEVESVYCQSSLRLFGDIEGVNIDDVSAVIFRFKNGTLGCMVSSCGAPKPIYKIGLEIICRELVLNLATAVTPSVLTLTYPHRTEQIFATVDPFLQEERVFIEAIKRKDSTQIKSSYSDALKTLEVTIAGNHSAKNKKTIYL